MEPIRPISRKRPTIEIVLRGERTSLRERDEHPDAGERRRRPPAHPQPEPQRPARADGDDGAPHIDVLA
jgi:hypothetical protein